MSETTECLNRIDALTDKLQECVMANHGDMGIGGILGAVACLVVHGVSERTDEEADEMIESFCALVRTLNAVDRRGEK